MIDKNKAKKTHKVAVVDGEVSRLEALLARLREALPSLVNSDGQVDARALADAVGDENMAENRHSSNDQGYELTFAGKGLARAAADSPTAYELKSEQAQSKDFDNTGNVVIRGDNIEALKILYQNYHQRIKMIYIDPPYNTESENFVYKDNFKQSDKQLIEELGMADETVDFLQNVYGTRSHSGWLAFMYPRLKLARELLSDDGVIFISIDDNEQANLKILCDEIFGEGNVEVMIWDKISGQSSAGSGKMKITHRFRKDHEFIVVCYKDKHNTTFNKPLEIFKYSNEYGNKDGDPRGNWLDTELCKSSEKSIAGGKNYYEIKTTAGLSITRQWHVSKEEFDALDKDNRIYWGKGSSIPRLKVFLNEKRAFTPTSILQNRGGTTDGNNDITILFGCKNLFQNPKPIKLLQFLLKITDSSNKIILDFFAGSGTTGDAVMQLNAEDGGSRKFILVQWDEEIDAKKNADSHKFCETHGLPPVISSITIERLKRAGEKIKESVQNRVDAMLKYPPPPPETLDLGFKVYSLKPKPELVDEGGKGGQMNLTAANLRESAADTLANMLCATGKPLHTQVECVVEGALYKADGEFYLLAAMESDELERHMKEAGGLHINLDGWADIDLQQYLNLGIHSGSEKAEHIKVIY